MTVRMNRAKGTHHVKGMAHIVGEMAHGAGRHAGEVVADLGMDEEEFKRLLDKGKMTARHGQGDFAQGLGSRLNDARHVAPASHTGWRGWPCCWSSGRTSHLLRTAPCFPTCPPWPDAFGPMLLDPACCWATLQCR